MATSQEVAGLQSDYLAKQNKDTRPSKTCAAITCLEIKHEGKKKKKAVEIILREILKYFFIPELLDLRYK